MKEPERTIERLKDLKEVAENKEVKQLATILITYLEGSEKAGIGFKGESKTK